MARRKNSAEMLDILRRMNREDKTRSARPPQKAGSSEAPIQEGRAPAAEPPVSIRTQGLNEPDRLKDPPFKPSRIDRNLKEKEGDEAPGRLRRAFLSVLSGGRESAVSPTDNRSLPPFGAPEAIPRKALGREEVGGRLPIAAGGDVHSGGAHSEDVEPISLAAPGRSRGNKIAGSKIADRGGEAHLGGAAQPVGVSGSAPSSREGAPVSPHAEYAPLGPRSPFSPPEGGVKEWPGAVLSPVEAPEGIFTPRETIPQAAPGDRAGPAEMATVPLATAAGDAGSDMENAAPLVSSDGETAPLQPAPRRSTPRKALLGTALIGKVGSARKLLASLAGRIDGRGFLAGIRKRLQVRIVTIGLYAVVAIGAMLLMAFILNPRDPGGRENQLPLDTQDAEADGSALKNLETTASGPGVPPAIRNVEPNAPAPQGTQVSDAAAITDGGVRIITSRKGEKGWFVQIRAFLSDKECELIIEHLKQLGYRSIWKQPNEKQSDYFYLLLGPYLSRKEADAVIPHYKELLAKAPLKKPKLRPTEPFVRENR